MLLFDNTPLIMVFVYGFFSALLMFLYSDAVGDGDEDFSTLLKYALYGAIFTTLIEWLSRLF